MAQPIQAKTRITANVICDSINPDGQRIVTFDLEYPRFIHSELMTHRVFSRNAASSRAIPISKVIDRVLRDPAKPIRWGKNGKGMQDHGAFRNGDEYICEQHWADAAANAVEQAENLAADGLHKQIVNRVLEPFVWMRTLVTCTDWENFFSLRVHKDAQPEFQYLSYRMLEKFVEESQPTHKNWGDWHMPFGDRMPPGLCIDDQLKIATARAARLSYLTMDGEIDVEKDYQLTAGLTNNGHWSPAEHPAQACKGRHGNFNGWKQYRKFFPNENRSCDLTALLASYRETFDGASYA